MSHSPATKEIDWIAVGWAVYAEDVGEAEFFPPLDDMEAQRWWLGGFGAAWAAAPDDRSVDEALVRVLTGEKVAKHLRKTCRGLSERAKKRPDKWTAPVRRDDERYR